jgi:hypothetical protein
MLVWVFEHSFGACPSLLYLQNADKVHCPGLQTTSFHTLPKDYIVFRKLVRFASYTRMACWTALRYARLISAKNVFDSIHRESDCCGITRFPRFVPAIARAEPILLHFMLTKRTRRSNTDRTKKFRIDHAWIILLSRTAGSRNGE